LNVKWLRENGVDPQRKFAYYLGHLQKVVFSDHTAGGIVYDVQEVGSTRSFSRSDDTPVGVLMADIFYRHRRDDPTVGAFDGQG
jgi:hypothetical protein